MAGSASTFSTIKGCIVLCVLLAGQTAAHEHHEDKIPEGSVISSDPIVRISLLRRKDADKLTFLQDSILWVHIIIQALAWGVIFPTGMVLGVSALTLYRGIPP